jgi:chromosome partitioning protein
VDRALAGLSAGMALDLHDHSSPPPTLLYTPIAAHPPMASPRGRNSRIVQFMAIIAVGGRKGGIGKSTIVGNLAGEFASMGRRVAVLDADPQHSLAAWAQQGDGMLARCVEKVEDGATTLRARVRTAEKKADIVLIDTPPGMPETAYQAALAADLMLLPCGPSPLDLFALKEALSLSLKARAERRSKKPRIRFVPSKVLMSTNLGRGLANSLAAMGKKVLPAIGQRIVVAEAVASGLTVAEYAPQSPAHEEFRALAKAVEKILDR